MNRTFLLVFYLLLTAPVFTAEAQDDSYYEINWLDNDLTPYDSYRIIDFNVNGQPVDYTMLERANRFVELFKKNMKKYGFDINDEAPLQAEFMIEVDTLPIGFQRNGPPLPEDQIVDITLVLRDSDVDEQLVTATVHRRVSDPKKTNKRVKEMLREFFSEAEMPQ